MPKVAAEIARVPIFWRDEVDFMEKKNNNSFLRSCDCAGNLLIEMA